MYAFTTKKNTGLFLPQIIFCSLLPSAPYCDQKIQKGLMILDASIVWCLNWDTLNQGLDFFQKVNKRHFLIRYKQMSRLRWSWLAWDKEEWNSPLCAYHFQAALLPFRLACPGVNGNEFEWAVITGSLQTTQYLWGSRGMLAHLVLHWYLKWYMSVGSWNKRLWSWERWDVWPLLGASGWALRMEGAKITTTCCKFWSNMTDSLGFPLLF